MGIRNSFKNKIFTDHYHYANSSVCHWQFAVPFIDHRQSVGQCLPSGRCCVCDVESVVVAVFVVVFVVVCRIVCFVVIFCPICRSSTFDQLEVTYRCDGGQCVAVPPVSLFVIFVFRQQRNHSAIEYQPKGQSCASHHQLHDPGHIWPIQRVQGTVEWWDLRLYQLRK